MPVPADFPWAPFVLAFLLGGTVKGALGVGLPLVAVPVLSLWLPTPQAIGLVVVPVLCSNLWQAVDGGRLMQSLERFRWLIAAQVVATIIAVRMTLAMTSSQMNVLLAAALLVAVLIMAFQPTVRLRETQETPVGAAVGLFSGLLGGVSSLTGPLVIAYLMSLKLDRENFIASISVIYLTAALPLYGTMWWYERISPSDFLLSGVALLPMALGLAVGKRLRQWLNEAVFHKVLLVFLTVLAALLLLK